MNVVLPCSDRKTHPAVIQARNFSCAEAWRKAFDEAIPRYPCINLYAGARWKAFLKVIEDHPNHDYWVLSAGAGLVRLEDEIPSYSASFSKRSLDYIPLDWAKLPDVPFRGVISASNEYAIIAKKIGLTIIKPSGRRWLHYFTGCSGFTLGPSILNLYLSGVDLGAIYNKLPKAEPQVCEKRIKKADAALLEKLYNSGMSAIALRRKANELGYSISVERAYNFVRTKQGIRK